jgi:hypothetical protein
MYRISIGLLVAGVIAFAPALTIAADLPAIQDTFTAAAAPATNYGTQDTMRVQKTGTRVALIRFDLAAAGALAPEPKVLLRVKVADVNRGGRIVVHRVLSDWQEGTVTFNTPLIISPEVVATYDVKPEDAGQVISIDVSAAAEEWRRAPGRNFGLAISAADFGGRPYLSLASREQESPPLLSFVDAERLNAVAQEQPSAPAQQGAGDPELDTSAQFLRR